MGHLAHRVRRRAPVAAAVSLLALAATAPVGPASAAKGPPTTTRAPKPTGAPIPLLMVNLEGHPGTTTPQASQAAKAAVRFVNSQGGIHDRPLALTVCGTDGTASAGKVCVDQAVASKPTVVYAVQPGGVSENLGALQAAGIPYVSESCNTSAELSGQYGAFCFSSNFVSLYAAAASYLKSLGTVRRASLAYVNQPAIVGGVKGFGLPLFQAAGIAVTEVPLPDGTPDITSAVTTALQADPDAYVSLTAGPGCVSTMQARSRLGSRIPFVYPALCADRDVVDDGGPGAVGSLFAGPTAAVDRTDPDVRAYRKAISRYARDVDPDDTLAQAGFAGIMNLATVMRAIPASADIDAQTLVLALRGTKQAPLFLGGGASFSCDGTALSPFRSLCSIKAPVVEYLGKGRFVERGAY